MRSFRRVVTGVNEQGQSCVTHDSDAPNTKPNKHVPGTGMVEFWCFETMPATLVGEDDLGQPPFTNDPPQEGAFFRYVVSAKVPDGYDAEKDPNAVPLHEEKYFPESGRGDRGGYQRGRSPMHMTRSVDYGFLMEGERTLILEDSEVHLRKGDVVIELGNYHAWGNPKSDSVMGYVMIGGSYDGKRKSG